MDHKEIPNEAVQALQVVTELLEGSLIGVYLYGSAVMGGLRVNSDVDILVVTDSSLSKQTSKAFDANLRKTWGAKRCETARGDSCQPKRGCSLAFSSKN